MLHMITKDITAPYSALEAWVYDRFIAGAVNEHVERLQTTELADVPRSARVLDVGCGGGHNLCSLGRARTDLQLTGLDLSPEQVARATRRGRDLGDRLRVVEGSALDLPFEDAAFDVVLSTGSIKHWPDPRAGLRECVRVLAPGGKLIVAELDRGCRLDDARAFIRRWAIPGLLGIVALAHFRTWIAGQGLDLQDARDLLDGLELDGSVAERVPEAPFLVLRGRARG